MSSARPAIPVGKLLANPSTSNPNGRTPPPSGGAPSSRKRVAILIGSARVVRVGPSIASLLYQYLATAHAHPDITLSVLDIADYNLPLFDEPVMPGQLTATSQYTHQHTRSWSTAVDAFDAFVMVTPQYNWSVPAALKNALDYLYFEWAGKPALVVSYGNRGGDKVAEHLVGICKGLRMDVAEQSVQLAFRKVDGAIAKAAASGALDPAMQAAWADEFVAAGRLYEEMLVKVRKGRIVRTAKTA